jgi:hypothetical protein
VFYALSEERELEPFLFSERTVAGVVYLGKSMSEVFVPILEEEVLMTYCSKKDGVPSHFHKEMTDFINRKCPEK